MLKMLNKYAAYIATGLFYLALAILLFVSGCQKQQPLVLVERAADSTRTTTTITHRDTVVVAAADSAKLALLVRDVDEFGRVLEELRQRAATARGTGNASVTLRVVGDTLFARADCDSVELHLANALTLISTLTERIREQERAVLLPAKAEDTNAVPGWLRGTFWLVLVLVAGAVIIKLALKYL